MLISEQTPEAWMETNLPAGARLGYDPWLHTAADVEKLSKAGSAAGAELVAAEPNPLDAVWSDRPAPPLGAVTLHEVRYAGEESSAKLDRIRAEVEKVRADALVVSDTTAIAWTFNIRGADVAHTPLTIAFAIVPKDGRASLFIDARKLSNTVRTALSDLCEVREPADFAPALTQLGAGKAHGAARSGHRRRSACRASSATPAARSSAPPIRSPP